MKSETAKFVVLKSSKRTIKDFSDAGGFTNEEFIGRPRQEIFGLTTNPPEGSRGIALFPEGDSEKAIFINFDSYENKKPADGVGSTRIWDAHGNSIDLHPSGVTVNSINKVVVNSVSPVEINAPSVSVKGDLSVSGACSFPGGTSVDGSGNVKLKGGDSPVARVGDLVQNGRIVSGNSGVLA